MTNLNKLIERRQGELDTEAKSLCQFFDWEEDSEQHHEILKSLLEAYRQALEDVLAGLPDDKQDGDDGMTGVGADGYNTALQNIRAQIEGLLSAIDTNS